jgi:hypothetical protein
MELYTDYQLNGMFNIDKFDYIKPIELLANQYKTSVYYKKMLKYVKKAKTPLISSDISDGIIIEYIKCRETARIKIIWDISKKNKIISKLKDICYIKEITLTNNSKIALVNQLFSCGKTIKEIHEYIKKMSITDTICVVVYEDEKGGDMSFSKTVEMAGIFFNNNSLGMLEVQLVDRLLDKSMIPSFEKINILKKIIVNNFNLLDQMRFLTISSIVLLTHGLRNINDVDVILSGNATEKQIKILHSLDYVDVSIPNTPEYTNEWEKELNRRAKKWGGKTINDIIFDPQHFYYFCGLKIISLEHDIDRRLERARPASTADIIAINIFMDMNIPWSIPEKYTQYNPKLKKDDIIIVNKNKYIDTVKYHLRTKYNLTPLSIIKMRYQKSTIYFYKQLQHFYDIYINSTKPAFDTYAENVIYKNKNILIFTHFNNIDPSLLPFPDKKIYYYYPIIKGGKHISDKLQSTVYRLNSVLDTHLTFNFKISEIINFFKNYNITKDNKVIIVVNKEPIYTVLKDIKNNMFITENGNISTNKISYFMYLEKITREKILEVYPTVEIKKGAYLYRNISADANIDTSKISRFYSIYPYINMVNPFKTLNYNNVKFKCLEYKLKRNLKSINLSIDTLFNNPILGYDDSNRFIYYDYTNRTKLLKDKLFNCSGNDLQLLERKNCNFNIIDYFGNGTFGKNRGDRSLYEIIFKTRRYSLTNIFSYSDVYYLDFLHNFDINIIVNHYGLFTKTNTFLDYEFVVNGDEISNKNIQFIKKYDDECSTSVKI